MPTPAKPASGSGHLDRRGFLQAGGIAALGLTLPAHLRCLAGASSGAKARNAVLVFLGGGPSHHETFDPKPDAAAEVRGEFGVVQTSVAGIHFSSAVPMLAEQMGNVAILRAVTHRDAAHEPGVAYMNTGYSFRPGHNFPGIGAVASFEFQERTRVNGLPAYIGIPDGRGGGHLGPAFNPFSIPGNPNDAAFRVQDVAPADGLTPERLARRRRLSADVNESFRADHPADVRDAVDRFTIQAYEMVTSPKAQAAFDLGKEVAKVRESYGRTQFGQRLLLARRLIEARVPFVAATDFEWDDHSGIFPKLKQRLPAVDQGLAALIKDLKARGLLEETLVIVLGEFGRTPKINNMQGRDHWPNAFSVLLAGGGVRGGQVVGSSDKDGAFPKDRPVTPEELFHTIYTLLGIDPTKFLPSTSGREVQIVRDGAVIRELID